MILESADRGPGRRRLFGVASPVLHAVISSVYFSIYWITCVALYFSTWVSSPWFSLSSFIWVIQSVVFMQNITLVIWFIYLDSGDHDVAF